MSCKCQKGCSTKCGCSKKSQYCNFWCDCKCNKFSHLKEATSGDGEVFVMDLETSGKNTKNDKIWEIFILHPASGDFFERTVNPIKTIHEDAVKKCHYSSRYTGN